jgi:hypothetical protein
MQKSNASTQHNARLVSRAVVAAFRSLASHSAAACCCHFDSRFVFCDNGTKKHPKIYGFSSLNAAARAFDILTCKRTLEKRTVAAVLAAGSVSGRPVLHYLHLFWSRAHAG